MVLTKIGSLELNMGNVTVVAKVISKSAVIPIRMKAYASAIIKDETCEIKLNL